MAPIRRGNNEPANLYVGSNPVQKLYRGSQQVWPAVPPGTADFKIYSYFGAGDEHHRGGREVTQSMIEMPAPANVSLYIDDVTGTNTTDFRRLSFTIDFDERYDAQFLGDTLLPADGRNWADPELGVYYGSVAGHSLRGTDMAGNQLLDMDYNGGPGPVGTIDKTVTVTVSDGVNTGSKSFTVRLIDPHRYYRDASASVYGTAANTPPHMRYPSWQRNGVIYVSQDGDFTGCPVGPKIYHYTIPTGILQNNLFMNSGTPNRDIVEATVEGDPSTKVQRSQFPFGQGTTAVYLKGGATPWTMRAIPNFGSFRLLTDLPNQQLRSWGGERALLSFRNFETLGRTPAQAMFLGGLDFVGFNGARFIDLDFHCSDWEVDNSEVREWWNILNYTGKTGTIAGNTVATLKETNYDGDVLTNNNGAYTQVIRDDDNGDGTGTLITRQVVTSSNVEWGEFTSFADGETLEGPTGTVVFDAVGSRQDRTKRIPPSLFAWDGGFGTQGPIAQMFDNCIMRGMFTCFASPPEWLTVSDSIIKNYFNYGFIGDARNIANSGLVITLPSNYNGPPRILNSGNANNKATLNSTMDSENGLVGGLPGPQVPALNLPNHCPHRYGRITTWGVHKCANHSYSGHGSLPQSQMRLSTNGAAVNSQQVVMKSSLFSGGRNMVSIATMEGGALYTPKAWVIEDCWLRGDFCNDVAYIYSEATNMGILNCLIGTGAGITTFRPNDFPFLLFSNGPAMDADPDVNAVPTIVEGCTFIYKADGNPTGDLTFDTSIRDIPILYANNTLDVDLTKIQTAQQPPTNVLMR